jgi:hypothetical protein
MDSTELMRELNSSIDMLMDSENYLLALNESINQVQSLLFHTSITTGYCSYPINMVRNFIMSAQSRRL